MRTNILILLRNPTARGTSFLIHLSPPYHALVAYIGIIEVKLKPDLLLVHHFPGERRGLPPQ